MMDIQPPLFAPAPKIFSVSQLNELIAAVFKRESAFQAVWVEGEISNLTRAASGHWYFSLKDSQSQLKALMWREATLRLDFTPQNGDRVQAMGRLSVYPARGEYQLYAETLLPMGLGALYQQYEALRQKLSAEGLFDAERKRPLPRYPRVIGVVTSPDAAAFQDVQNVLARRYPCAEIILSPTLVQGVQAPPRIVAALEAINQRPEIDVLLVVRGGGSLEDLWCFNDERVVRAVAASRIPTISGVGHEIDFTLTDFAADRRAPTPSAAAELATPDRAELQAQLRAVEQRLANRLREAFEDRQETLENAKRTLRLLTPQTQIDRLRQALDENAARLSASLRQHMESQTARLRLLESRLHSASPSTLLARGYVIASRPDGTPLTRRADVQVGERLLLRFQDGALSVTAQGDPT
jgi:exodeoxyribonuclease VII large subunit